MKIRTRLLLFLLPTLICSVTLVSILFAMNWYKEILAGFQTRLKSAVVSTASIHASQKELEMVLQGLEVTDLYFVPIDSPEIELISKKVHITPIYQSKEGEKRMTGYAPVLNESGHITGLMAADINVSLIDQKFQEGLLLIIICAGLTILVMVITLFIIANKISRPVQRLNNSALAIAAGQYGESVQVDGPKEIAELANTLNTMSECLHENINRLKENSLLRERLYGEYECAMLLQHMMLQKNIDSSRSDAIAIKSITFFSENPKGFLLDFPKTERPDQFLFHIAEAKEEGFEGMYQLLTQHKLYKEQLGKDSIWEQEPYTLFELDKVNKILTYKGPHTPLLWSLEKRGYENAIQEKFPIESGDYLFLYNQGLFHFLKGENHILDLIAKVLKIFASDGLETTAAMLQKELAFATKRKELLDDIHLLCFQILNI